MMKDWRFIVIGLVLAGAWGLAFAMHPTPVIEVGAVDFQKQIPEHFGDWKEVRSALVQMDLAPRAEDGTQEADMAWPYDKTLSRTYMRSDGEVIMLALAWGSKQRQEIKVHRPELCYVAQGFQVLQTERIPLQLNATKQLNATRLVTRSQSRSELVTYWVRIGDKISGGGLQTRLGILTEGLKGRIPDGILVRVSQAGALDGIDAAKSYAVQEAFMKALVGHVDPFTVALLTGSQSAR
jgi:EpsI family protein